MLLILALSLVFALTLLGWGALAAAVLERMARVALRGTVAFGEYGLLGLAVLAPLAFLLHIFIALGGIVGIAVIAIGLAGIVAGRRRLLAALGFGLRPALTGMLLLGLLVAICGETVQQQMPYDSGLYHLQTILMAEDSRVVLGAANIHMRFGYNSAWLILCALFALPGQALGGAIVLNGIVGLFGLTGMVQRIGNVSGRPGVAPSAIFAGGAVLLIALAKLLRHNIGGPSTDFPSGLLTIYAFLLALVVAEIPSAGRIDAPARGAMLIAFPISALAIVCKTSQMPVALAVLLVAATFIPRRVSGGRRLVLAGAISAILLAACWLIHGFALSGCALYPVSASCLAGLPWTVPPALADSDLAWITSFARIPDTGRGLVPNDWRWVPVWLAEMRGERLVVCLKVVLGLILALGLLRLAAGRRLHCLGETLDPTGRKVVLGLFAIATAGLCYWFLAAPALRFGYGFIVAGPLILLSLTVPVARSSRAVTRATNWVAPGLATLAFFLGIQVATEQTAVSLFAMDRPTIPVVELSEQRSVDGRSYSSPKTGDSCWAAPRFCTPYPSPGLEFGHLGPWQTAVAAP